MGNSNGESPSAGARTSPRGSGSPYRHIPATLASLSLLAVLLGTDAARQAEPWFYGLFLGGKGGPPLSPSTLIVSADSGGAALDAGGLARLAAAILEREPAVVALGPLEEGKGRAGASPDEGGRLPAGPLVIAFRFAGYRTWSLSDETGTSYPPILSRSLYPLLDGPESGLVLPMGEGPELSDASLARAIRQEGVPEPTAGFAAMEADPEKAETDPNQVGTGAGAKLLSVPAFARLGRGVVAGLGVEAVRRTLGVPPEKVGYVEGAGVLFDSRHVLPIDARGEVPARFHGRNGIARIPASRFLEGRVSASEVKGRTVFVDPAAPDGPRMETVAGPRSPTEIQASVAAGLLDGTGIATPAWAQVLPKVVGTLLAAFMALILILDFGTASAFALALLLAALYPAAALAAFLASSLWMPPELPPLMVAALYLPFAATRLLFPGRRVPAVKARTDRGRMEPGHPQSIQPSPVFDAALVMPPQARLLPAGTPPPSSFPSHPQSIPPRPRPHAPRERQGGAPAPDPRAEAQRPAAPTMAAFRPAQAAPPIQAITPAAGTPVVPAVPAAHSGTVGDDIERDGKGGLVRVGKYRIVRKMGFGSAGDVFEGFDTHMGRKVAIKTITKNAAIHFDRASERFVLEAKAAGSLNHPCINTIYDFGAIRDVSYMVLEFLDGVTLSQWMRGTPVPPAPAAVVHWLRQICSALDYAHAQKVIHRDLKPANLMVVNNGATIKLLDFGIAKMEDMGLTQTGMTVGTPSYMSPEQLSGIKVGPASDQYGLAVVIYQLFTYKLPYLGTKIPELCNRILKNDIIPITEVNPSLGGPFWEALRKAMAKAPEERHPNCMALCAALEAAFPGA